ncbi:hypothetical protein GCM10027162_64110 [Streptomyces incanus]
MEPLVEMEWPYLCVHCHVMSPALAAALQVIRQLASASNTSKYPEPRYSLGEVCKRGILPWTPQTARAYMRKRSPSRWIGTAATGDYYAWIRVAARVAPGGYGRGYDAKRAAPGNYETLLANPGAERDVGLQNPLWS